MTGSPGIRDEAVVLSSRAYGDSDAIVQLFTLGQGRAAVFARGMRSSKKKEVLLCPTYEVSLELHRRPGSELFTASAIDLRNPHLALREQLVPLAAANVILEACRDMFKEGDADAEVYGALTRTLSDLATESPLFVLGRFERYLLERLGYDGQNATQVSGFTLADFQKHSRVFEQISGHKLEARRFFVEVAR